MSKLSPGPLVGRLVQAFFGVRVTVLYSNGAKLRMRARVFNINYKNGAITSAEWARPVFSWSREPIFLNVDKIDAIWQGRA